MSLVQKIGVLSTEKWQKMAKSPQTLLQSIAENSVLCYNSIRKGMLFSGQFRPGEYTHPKETATGGDQHDRDRIQSASNPRGAAGLCQKHEPVQYAIYAGSL